MGPRTSSSTETMHPVCSACNRGCTRPHEGSPSTCRTVVLVDITSGVVSVLVLQCKVGSNGNMVYPHSSKWQRADFTLTFPLCVVDTLCLVALACLSHKVIGQIVLQSSQISFKSLHGRCFYFKISQTDFAWYSCSFLGTTPNLALLWSWDRIECTPRPPPPPDSRRPHTMVSSHPHGRATRNKTCRYRGICTTNERGTVCWDACPAPLRNWPCVPRFLAGVFDSEELQSPNRGHRN